MGWFDSAPSWSQPILNDTVSYYSGGGVDIAKNVKENLDAPAEEARKRTKIFEDTTNQQLADARAHQEKVDAQASALAMRSALRQQYVGQLSKPTILTSPLGIINSPTGGGKTAIGT